MAPDQIALAYLSIDDWDDIDVGEMQRAEVMALVDALVREGLVSMVPLLRYAGPTLATLAESPISQDGMDIRITYLGQQFLAACTPPSRAQNTSHSPPIR